MIAAQIFVVPDEVVFLSQRRRPQRKLRLAIVGPVLVLQLWQSEGGEDADDGGDREQLKYGKTLLAAVYAQRAAC